MGTGSSKNMRSHSLETKPLISQAPVVSDKKENADKQQALSMACTMGDLVTVQQLFDEDVEPLIDSRGFTLIHIACQNTNLSLLKLLLKFFKKKLDIHAKTINGCTAFVLAAFAAVTTQYLNPNATHILKLLLQHGATFSPEDKNKLTELFKNKSFRESNKKDLSSDEIKKQANIIESELDKRFQLIIAEIQPTAPAGTSFFSPSPSTETLSLGDITFRG